MERVEMRKFKYVTRTFEYSSGKEEDILKEMGENGWELVCVFNFYRPDNNVWLRMYFKKEIE